MRIEQQHTLPIACNLSAIPPEQRNRYQELRDLLQEKALQVDELPDGYAFKFLAGTVSVIDLAEFITMERLCCPFIDFSLQFPAGNSPITLLLSGEGGVKDVLQAELEIE